jgi:hypothetical protein
MTKSTSESWITSLYILAFIRVALILIPIITGFAPTRNLLDVAIGLILGIGAYRGQLWAGYGLILWAGYSFAFELVLGTGSGLFPLLWLVLYTTGTIHLYRSKGFASLPRLHAWFIIRWCIWILFIGFLAGFLRTFNPPFLTTLLGETHSSSRFWSITIAAYVLILASQAVAARRKGEWSLEHILCIALAVALAGGSLDAFFGQSLVLSLVSSIYTFILTFIAWGIAQSLKSKPPLRIITEQLAQDRLSEAT